MPGHGLADFLETLSARKELLRVAVEVSAAEEIAEITDRVVRAGNQAILFERVAGNRIPVVTNLLGSERRICLALGIDSPVEIPVRLGSLFRGNRSEGLLNQLRATSSPASFATKRVKTAPCQQVVRLGGDIDLAKLPLVRAWGGDQQSAIHAAQVYTRDAADGVRRLTNFPITVIDRQRLALHFEPTSEFAQGLHHWKSRAEHMPVALVLSGDAGALIAALLPIPTGVDAALVVGALRNAPLEVAKCRSHDLEIPADAELVIEGFIDPAQGLAEGGAFGTDLGFQAEPAPAVVMEVAAITHRASAILPVMVLGPPPHELCALRQAVESLLLPIAQVLAPEVIDYDFPDCGARRNVCFVAIRKSHAQQARKVASLLWGLSAWMSTRLLVVVDEDVDVNNANAVWQRVAVNVHPQRDVFFHEGPASRFDHATPQPGCASMLGVDATTKLAGEHPRPWPEPVQASESIRELVQSRWSQYGLGGDPGSR